MTHCHLVCSGLGRVSRGLESFTRECHDALRGRDDLRVTLFAGGGGRAADDEVVLFNLPRGSRSAIWAGRPFGLDGRWSEQATFALSHIAHMARRGEPDV